MARIFADENVRRGVVDELRVLGHDVLRAHEAGRANLSYSDEDQLQFATQDQRAILTNDRRDFHALHAADANHGGIITFTFDPDDVALARRIHQEILPTPILAGQLIKVVRPSPP